MRWDTMSAALEVEWAKLRRSRTVWVTTLALLVLPPVLSRAMLAAAGRDGTDAFSTKAAALGLGEGWEGYVDGLLQVFASAGLLGFGVVVAWAFGREFADGTVGALFAAAVPRTAIATAKLALLTAWGLLVGVVAPVAALVMGLLTGLGVPDADALDGLLRFTALATTTAFLTAPVALTASVGRGYLPAFGVIIGLVALAQLVVVLGVGGWVPWSAPGVWAASGPGTGLEPVPAARLLLAPASAVVLGLATARWWRSAEVV